LLRAERAGRGGGGQRLAVAGVAFGVLPHDQLADERGDLRSVPPGDFRQRVGDHAGRHGGGALTAQQRGTVALRLPDLFGRLGDRAEQRQR
jgi:hypothetical protein